MLSTLARRIWGKNPGESDLPWQTSSLSRMNSVCVVVAICSSPPESRKVVRYVSWTHASPLACHAIMPQKGGIDKRVLRPDGSKRSSSCSQRHNL